MECASPWAPAGRVGRTHEVPCLFPGEGATLGSSRDAAAGLGSSKEHLLLARARARDGEGILPAAGQ